MTFEEILDQAMAMLQRRGRLTYRTLKLQFHLDDEHVEALKDELIYGQRLAVDEDDRVLVWTGAEVSAPHPPAPQVSSQDRLPLAYTPPYLAEKILTSKNTLEGERKQVTVLFADLKPQGLHRTYPRPRSRSRPATPRPGLAAHDGCRAPALSSCWD